jgi:hypothetical protein
LFDVAVLVRDPEIIGRRLHPIVGHEGGVPVGRLASAVPIERPHRGAEMIGPMLPGHPTDLPQTDFDPFGEGFETLGQDKVDRFDIRIDQDEMEEQVRERDPAEGHPEIGHVGKVRLGDDARAMELAEENLPRRPVLGAPGGDLALEGPELGGLVVVRPALAEQGKERRRLQSRVAGELLLDPRPVVGERIGAGPIAAWRLQLAGQRAASFVGAGGPHAHPRPRGGLFLRLPFGAFAHHDPDLPVGLHDALLRGCHARSRAAVGQANRQL